MAVTDWRDRSSAKLQASPAGVERFKKDRFGLSVHWGLYSIGADKEWMQALAKIPREEYARLQARFDPCAFSAENWIAAAAGAGCTAFLVTTKHHDGFCLFDSEHTDFTAAKAPIGRDLLAELAEACHQRNISLHFYYSLIDWHHPLAGDCEFNPPKDFDGYCQYMLAQINELCTNYGHVAGFLFDGWWPEAKAADDQVEAARIDDWPLAEIYDLIHTLQPDAMITNNHHILPLPGEDYQVWEQDLPGENIAGFNCETVGEKPAMAWITSHDGWSWQREHRIKTPETILEMRKRCADLGAPLFLNVGPRGDGRIDLGEPELLRRIGKAEC